MASLYRDALQDKDDATLRLREFVSSPWDSSPADIYPVCFVRFGETLQATVFPGSATYGADVNLVKSSKESAALRVLSHRWMGGSDITPAILHLL